MGNSYGRNDHIVDRESIEERSSYRSAVKKSVIVYSTDMIVKELIESSHECSTEEIISSYKKAYEFFKKTTDNVLIKCGNSMLSREITRVPLSRYRFISLDYGWEGYKIRQVKHGYLYDKRPLFNDIDFIDDKELRKELEHIIKTDYYKELYKGMDPEYREDGKVVITLKD